MECPKVVRSEKREPGSSAGALGKCDTKAAGSRISATEFFEKKFVSVPQLGWRKFLPELRGLFKERRSGLTLGDEIFDRRVQRATSYERAQA